ncbi:MAG: phosphoenolpyruvate--protein phosphotransferase [Spirochaetales bacterium]|nr:phosphoenolpyruvate--protein phosphotransferase [Spirochaetales bacterium]
MGEIEVRGISASPGIGMGKVFRLEQKRLVIPEEEIPEEQVEQEIGRFLEGRRKAFEQLAGIHARAVENLSGEEAEVFEGHLEILMDEDLEEEIKERIGGYRFSAEKALGEVFEENAREMEELENPYMRERAADLRDIGRRLLYAVAGEELVSLDSLEEEVIVIAEDLTPSDTAQMDKKRILGFATERGGLTSHVTIMAKSLEIPAVVGAGELLSHCRDNQIAVLDGTAGSVVFDPREETRSACGEKISLLKKEREFLDRLRDLPAETLDGHRVELCANIGSERELEGVLSHGAEGIGLFRTEFLYMDKGRLPTEEEQFAVYRKVAESLGGKGIIIRTLDIGGDKDVPGLGLQKEENPFLGWRAVRMCLDLPEMFALQLRAILRASHYGKLRIMYPMVISLSEIRRLNALLGKAKDDLRAAGVPFDEDIEVGIMIETPAAALTAHILIREVDFFSIGTNDLTQYTLAVDRGNERIADLYQPLHPAVLQLIHRVILASHEEGKWTGMCGELAGDERAAPLLLGMGLDEFSMSAGSIPRIKDIIRRSSRADLRELAVRVLNAGESREILEILKAYRSESLSPGTQGQNDLI